MPCNSSPKQRKLKTLQHVRSLLASTCRNLEQKLIGPKEATAMANLCRVLGEIIKSCEEQNVAERVAVLESLLSAQSPQDEAEASKAPSGPIPN